jgi:hypothetical protein
VFAVTLLGQSTAFDDNLYGLPIPETVPYMVALLRVRWQTSWANGWVTTTFVNRHPSCGTTFYPNGKVTETFDGPFAS